MGDMTRMISFSFTRQFVMSSAARGRLEGSILPSLPCCNETQTNEEGHVDPKYLMSRVHISTNLPPIILLDVGPLLHMA